MELFFDTLDNIIKNNDIEKIKKKLYKFIVKFNNNNYY